MIRHMHPENGLLPIAVEPSQEPRIKRSPVIEQRKKGLSGQAQAYIGLKKLAATERDLAIWELLARGYSRRQIAAELGLSRPTVIKAINTMLSTADELIAENVEDYRTRQLAIYGEEIRRASKDAEMQPVPLLDENGQQQMSQNGRPKWEITPMEAAKTRDYGGRRLIQALKEEARLLGLLIQRHEVEVNQRIVAVVRSESGESIINMV